MKVIGAQGSRNIHKSKFSSKGLAIDRFSKIILVNNLAIYRISSPISLVIFLVSDAQISVIFHEKRSLSCSQGFGIQKQFLNSVGLLFFADNTSSVGRSLTFRASAYR